MTDSPPPAMPPHIPPLPAASPLPSPPPLPMPDVFGIGIPGWDTVDPLGLRYAGFWIRLLAYIGDCLLCTLWSAANGAAGVGALRLMFPEAHPGDLTMAGLALGWVAWSLYFILFVTGGWAATPVKRLVGIHVVRYDRRPIGFGRALAREAMRSITPNFTLGIGFLAAAFTREKTALHDLACDTRVVWGRI